MPNILSLPSELTIYTVGELRPRWLEWLASQQTTDAAGDTTCHVDAAAVSEVDAAGLQLLLALSRSLEAENQTLRLDNPSASLVAACQALGLDALMADQDSVEVPA